MPNSRYRMGGNSLLWKVLGRVHREDIAERVHEAGRHGDPFVEGAAEHVGEMGGGEAMQGVCERRRLHAQHEAKRRLGAQLGAMSFEHAKQVGLAATLRGARRTLRSIATPRSTRARPSSSCARRAASLWSAWSRSAPTTARLSSKY
jgi:hypothetical protein